MSKTKLIRKGAEVLGGKKGSAAKPKTKGDKPKDGKGDAVPKNGENATTAAKDAKNGNAFSRHPYLTGAGAAGVLGVGGLAAGAALSGGGDPAAKLSRQDTGGSSGTGGGALDSLLNDGSNPFTNGNGDAIEIDPEVLTAFAAELARLGDAALAAADSAPDAFDALAERMRRDQLGASTRSGGASPVFADMDAALTETRDAYVTAAQATAAQLHGDSQRLLTIIANHEEVEQDNASALNSVDTNL